MKKKIKIQIKSIYGKLLFEYSCINNTVSKTVEKAVNKSANLSYADLSYADLSYADLRYANLSYADLSYADLRYANLRYADLRYADLSYADLRYANFRYADLSSADFRYADLSYADLSYAENIELINAMQCILPQGELIGWKKVNDKILKLLIPKKAKRLNSLGSRKCRASEVKTLEIDGKKSGKTNSKRGKVVYQVGKISKPDKFDSDIQTECSNGIHFFITKEEAENW